MLLLQFPFHRWENWGSISLGDVVNPNSELNTSLLMPSHCFAGKSLCLKEQSESDAGGKGAPRKREKGKGVRDQPRLTG